MIRTVHPRLLFRDVQFNIALFLGPLFWAGWFCLNQPVLKLSRAIIYPGKFLLLAAIFPVLEEFVFRGWLQETFSRITKGAMFVYALSVSNILTSVIFGFSHMFFHSAFWSCFVAVPSLIFGYFKERHNNLFPCIILHIFYNSGYYLLFNDFAVSDM